MNFQSAGYQLLPVLPELVLAVGAMVLLMLGAYRGQETTRLVTTLAIVLLAVTGVLELLLPAGKLTTFSGSFIVDDFARFLKILALIGSAATLILSAEFLSDPSRRIFEYSILVVLSTLGMMLLISAGDLINDLKAMGKPAFFAEDRNLFLEAVRPHLTDDCVLLLMGARDPSLENFAKRVWEEL